jgi:hypothetical protein
VGEYSKYWCREKYIEVTVPVLLRGIILAEKGADNTLVVSTVVIVTI